MIPFLKNNGLHFNAVRIGVFCIHHDLAYLNSIWRDTSEFPILFEPRTKTDPAGNGPSRRPAHGTKV